MKKHTIFKPDNIKFGFSLTTDKRILFNAPDILLKNLDFENTFEQIQLLKKYVYLLRNYANSNNDNMAFARQDNKSTPLDIIESYINIVNDFIMNGDFLIFSKLNKKSQNKINWNKTIRNNDVIIQDNKILYGEFRSNDKKINMDDIFFKIYASTLRDATEMFLNGPANEIVSDLNEKEALYYINKYLDSHFKDREIYIAKQLKRIYSDRSLTSINEEIFSVKYHENFEYIFQFLIETNIEKYSIKHNFKTNKGSYKQVGTGKTTNGMSLKLDHIIDYNKKYYILDSKYYREYTFDKKYPEKSNFPLTADIIKQVGYKLYVSKINNIPLSEINSVFIFPILSNEVSTACAYFADHIVENDMEDHFLIRCIKVDVNKLVDNFIAGKLNQELLDCLT